MTIREKRKVGEGEEYEDCMEKAEKLYLEHKMKFGENLLSEVIYLHSHARLISEKRIPDKPKELYEKALKICEQKLPNHPERVATLLFAGRNTKRRNEYEQAEEQLNQALNLSKNCPGEHVMTVQCFKDIADLRFFVKRKVLKGERSFDTVLPYYEKSLEMLEHLGMDGHKETILTLKNCGFCHSSNGNYEKARKFLERAERVAERELENDHRWKVMMKTQQALVFDKENQEDQMIEAMKSGLKMCYKLGKTIEDLGNKHEIRKVLHRHPNKFPKDEYPRWKEWTLFSSWIKNESTRNFKPFTEQLTSHYLWLEDRYVTFLDIIINLPLQKLFCIMNFKQHCLRRVLFCSILE